MKLNPSRFILLVASLSATLLLSPVATFAYDLERAVLNLSADLSQCGAYFAIVAQLPENPEHVTDRYEKASINMLQLAIETSNEKAAVARMQTAIKGMFAELDGSLGNMSILINQYADMCQQMSNDIEPRLQYWLDKED